MQALNIISVDSQIEKFKALDQKIKALKVEQDEIKKGLLNGYFAKHDSYITQDGRLLATYKEQIRVVLDQKLLKEAHPEIVDEFSKLQSIKVFLCK